MLTGMGCRESFTATVIATATLLRVHAAAESFAEVDHRSAAATGVVRRVEDTNMTALTQAASCRLRTARSLISVSRFHHYYCSTGSHSSVCAGNTSGY